MQSPYSLLSLIMVNVHYTHVGMTIQGGSHDSVEDARTALLLYRKHQQLTAKGDLANRLRELYDAGREHQWKIPGQ